MPGRRLTCSMKILRHLNPGFGQFRWVVLLLAVAVILPTVCLLWFMNEVVKSERLVVRQRLTTFYRTVSPKSPARSAAQWAESCRPLERRPSVHPYRQFVAAVAQSGCEGLLDLRRDRPASLSRHLDRRRTGRPSEDFRDAWELEFINQQYEQAADKYEE